MNQPILNGILESDLDLNGYGFVNIGGLLGTFVTSTESTTVDGQVALFNGTGGKIIRKATATGIAKLSSGVLSAVTAPTGDLVGHDDTQTLYNKTLALTTIANTGLNFVRPNGAGIVQLLVQDGASSIFSYLPSTSGTLITSAEVSAGYVAKTGSLALAGFSSITGRIGNANLPLAAQLKDVNGVLSVDGDHRILKADDGTESLAWDFTGVTSPGFFGNGSGLTNLVGDNTAYNATTWDGNTGVPTKNAIRDKFESLGGVTSVSVITANGISGSVANATTTPAITLSLGAIKPDSITAPNDTPMIVSGGRHVAGPTFLGASITLDPAAPSTHLANITLTPVAGGSVIIASLTSNGLLKTSGGTGTISVDTSSYALTTNPLSQFAATTSAQLRGVISDETGTGALVFAVGPILDGPVIGGSINLKGNLLDDNIASILSITQTVDNTVLTIPDFAGEPDEFTFNVKSQTLSNKTFVAPILGTPASGTLTNCTGLPIGGINFLDTDGTLAANSDAKVASQKAVKTYVTAHTVTNSAGANVVPKSNGTNLIASSIVDDGTVVKGGYGATKFLFDGGVAGLLTIGDIDGTANGTKIVIDDNNTEVDITGELFLNGNLNPSDGSNITFGTSTGSQLGTTTSDKIGFWSAAPVVQNTGWGSITNVTSDKVYNANSTTLDEVADVLGTLIAQLVTYGILGA